MNESDIQFSRSITLIDLFIKLGLTVPEVAWGLQSFENGCTVSEALFSALTLNKKVEK